MAQIVPSSISTIKYEDPNTWRSSRVNIDDLIDQKIQETVSDMKSKLTAMECKGCGGNIDPQTLTCTCCGKQYRLEAVDG